jgi:hypothetical protein
MRGGQVRLEPSVSAGDDRCGAAPSRQAPPAVGSLERDGDRPVARTDTDLVRLVGADVVRATAGAATGRIVAEDPLPAGRTAVAIAAAAGMAEARASAAAARRAVSRTSVGAAARRADATGRANGSDRRLRDAGGTTVLCSPPVKANVVVADP